MPFYNGANSSGSVLPDRETRAMSVLTCTSAVLASRMLCLVRAVGPELQAAADLLRYRPGFCPQVTCAPHLGQCARISPWSWPRYGLCTDPFGMTVAAPIRLKCARLGLWGGETRHMPQSGNALKLESISALWHRQTGGVATTPGSSEGGESLHGPDSVQYQSTIFIPSVLDVNLTLI